MLVASFLSLLPYRVSLSLPLAGSSCGWRPLWATMGTGRPTWSGGPTQGGCDCVTESSRPAPSLLLGQHRWCCFHSEEKCHRLSHTASPLMYSSQDSLHLEHLQGGVGRWVAAGSADYLLVKCHGLRNSQTASIWQKDSGPRKTNKACWRTFILRPRFVKNIWGWWLAHHKNKEARRKKTLWAWCHNCWC